MGRSELSADGSGLVRSTLRVGDGDMVDFVVPMGNRCGFHVTGMMDGSTGRLLLRHVVK